MVLHICDSCSFLSNFYDRKPHEAIGFIKQISGKSYSPFYLKTLLQIEIYALGQDTEDFPVTKKYSYLANAAISPIPSQVQNAVLEFYKESMSSGGTRWQKWIDCVEDARRMASLSLGLVSKKSRLLIQQAKE